MAVARALHERQTGVALNTRLTDAVTFARAGELSTCKGATATRSIANPQPGVAETPEISLADSINPWSAPSEDVSFASDPIAAPSHRPVTQKVQISLFSVLTVAPASASVQCLDIDTTEDRYLLFCDASGGIGLVDCAELADGSLPTPLTAAHPKPSTASSAGITVPTHLPGKPLSCVKWYPHDSGMFFTSGMDSRAVVWDSNRMTAAFAFHFEGQAMCMDMSRCATSHSLLSVGISDGSVVLADLVSCAATHKFYPGTSSSSEVTCTAWSPSHEHLLFSGSSDGVIRIWDCRRSGGSALLAVLDEGHIDRLQTAAPPAINPSMAYGSRTAIAHAPGVSTLMFPAPIKLMSSSSTSISHENMLFSFGRDGNARRWRVVDSVSTDDVTHLSYVNTATRYPVARSAKRRCFYGAAMRVGFAYDDFILAYPGPPINSRQPHYMSSIAGAGGSMSTSSAGAVASSVLLVNAVSGKLEGELFGAHAGGINAVAYRETRQQIFSGGEDGCIMVWEPPLLRPRGRDQQTG